MPRTSRPARRPLARALVVSFLAVVSIAALSAAAPSLVVPAGLPGAAGEAAPGAAAPDAPNIVLISTDDQTTYDLRWMPFTRSLVGGHGVEFITGLSPHSLCCPARAEMVTGQYGQNNGVHHNNGPRGGFQALIDPDNTIGRWLHDAGYQTAMVGKYLNAYGARSPRPEGWDHWNPFAGTTDFTTTPYYNDGDPVMRQGYVDDVTNSYARDYIDEFSGEQPFFVWVSNYAPHRAQYRSGGWAEYSYPAPRHQRTLTDARLPSLAKRSFNERNVSDQPGVTRGPKQDPAEMQQRFLSRIQALQAADEGVRDLVQSLVDNGELDSTYIFFVSDNGYLLGEHRLSYKNYIFREAMEVPFLVRTPDATSRTVSQVPVTLTDLAPTIAELAGATPQRTVDGVSFAPLLRGDSMPWRDTQLIQTGRPGASHDSWRIRGVRTARYTYGRDVTNGFEQLYDRRRTPSEIRNVADNPAYHAVRRELRARTRALKDCSGAGCAADFGRVPKRR